VRPRVRLALLTALASLGAGLALPIGPAAAGSYGPEGPDVASYQHKNGAAIDWTRVAASGHEFTFIKATEGTTYTNPWFAGDWQDSAAAGLIHGAYHYARPYTDLNTAHSQAQAFATTIGPQSVSGTLPPALDLEEAGGLTTAQLQSWVTTFLTDLQSLTGRTPMIYTYPYFWQHSMGNSSAYTGYPLWIANYGVSAPTTLTWPRWTFWQYTSTGTVDGISTTGGTDVDQFNGSSQQLSDLALGRPVQPSPGPTPSSTDSPSPGPTASPTPSATPSPTAAPSPTPKPSPSPSGSSSGTWGPGTSGPDDNPPPQNVSTGPRSSRYVGVAPVRFVDTRSGIGAPSGPTHRPLTITIPSSVPVDAPGVVLNVSVVQPSHGGFLRAAATGQQPTTTALNFADGQSVTGLVVTPMDSQRRVTLTPYTTITDVVVDLVGYYTTATGTGGHWNALPPSRFVDTRAGRGAPSGAHTGDVTIQVPSSVPADATGVVLDLSVVDPGGDGYLRLAPTGSTPKTTALNFTAGQSVTGLAVSRMQNRQITVSIFGAPANLVVDLIGYYDAASSAGGSYIAIAPQRFLDTRGGMGATGPGRGPVTISLPASVPAAATSVVIDVSVVTPDGRGYVRLSAPGDSPTTTSLNYLAAQNTTGLAISGIRNRQITVTVYGAQTQLVADVVGYHAG
jgi:GH25 family lysozyme M1 (1,4-beta-N-acetylmuramidase)